MTIQAGFGGQDLIPETLDKVRAARAWRDQHGLAYHIEVDGGVNARTLPDVLRAGANAIVAGTALFGAPDMGAAVQHFRTLAV
jgi:ribulose-phosphate 3-epimerase